MIFGIGVDLIETKKIKESIKKTEFLQKVFTENEIKYCNDFKLNELHFAGKFAAKEAFIKALGTGFKNGIEWRDIEIKNESSGKPRLFLSKKIEKLINEIRVTNILVSISHSDEYAIAQVVLEVTNI